MKKKLFPRLSLLIALFLAIFFSYAYVHNFRFTENLNNKFNDFLFNLREKKTPDSDIVIVNIDEKTLHSVGNFSRIEFAKLINQLKKLKVSVIALDISFPYRAKKLENGKSVDEFLAKSFKDANLISGYIFNFSDIVHEGDVPNISSIIIKKGYQHKSFLPEAKGIISNIELLQKSSHSSGFISLISDDDGVVRSNPLVVKYRDRLYPSLALEVVRDILQKKTITIKYTEVGIEDISLGKFSIPTDRFGRLILNYKGSSKTYRYISAIDILEGRVKKEFLKNKIVLLSSSTSRFQDLRPMPLDSTFEGVEIQATTIDNILHRDFLIKPNWLESLNIIIIFLMLFFIFVFSFLGPIKNALLPLLLVVGFLYFDFYMFVHFGLFLNVIFPVSVGIIYYLILTFMHYLLEFKDRERLHKELIKQMKSTEATISKEVKQKTKDLQNALNEKNILFRELHHRVKNNLQLVLSITRLQQYNIRDKSALREFEKLQGRIKSIAKTHQILCDSGNVSNVDMHEYIGSLCVEISNALTKNNIKIVQEISSSMPLSQAVYIGLIVNELVSNSIKHAFDENGGNIYINLAKNSNQYTLLVGDDGNNYDFKTKDNNSLGLKLVDSLVMSQLDGSISFDMKEKYKYKIRFAIVSV